LYIEMRGPDGVTYPMRGTFEVVSPPSEIVFTSAALDDAGHAMFETRFAIAFEAVGADTRLSVRGELISEAPDTRQFSEGMEAGWMQMLDKLETFLDGTADREIRLMRLISAPPDAVYAAWTDPDRVGRWW